MRRSQHLRESDDEQGPGRHHPVRAMVAEDRRLRLAGYEVYRFGAQELVLPGAPHLVAAFFNGLQQLSTVSQTDLDPIFRSRRQSHRHA